jgi:hypothetical protein
MSNNNQGESAQIIILRIILAVVGILGGASAPWWLPLVLKNTTGNNPSSGVTKTPIPPTPGSSKDTDFRVVEAILRADPFNYTGSCPVKITFSGRISVIGGSGVVSYKFLRSDGASAPIETVRFDSPGSKDVIDTWTLGASGTKYSGWESIKIFEPGELTSNQANFKIQCE